MILTCPNCASRFRIDADKLGMRGRKVRCANCQHKWLATPDDDTENGAKSYDDPEAAFEAAREGADSDADAADDAPPEGPEETPAENEDGGFEDFETLRAHFENRDGGSRRKRPAAAAPAPKRRLPLILGWLLFAAALGGIGAGGWFGRHALVETFPTTARVYDLMGVPVNAVAPGLDFRNISRRRQLVDGVSRLVIAGEIVNNTGATRPVPNLNVVLLDESGRAVMQWQISAKAAALVPGDSTSFETRRANTPKSARRVSLTFARPGA